MKKSILTKKSIALLALSAMLAGTSVYADTSEDSALISAPTDIAVRESYSFKIGEIKDVSEENILIDAYGSELAVNIGESTEILDADLMPLELSNLKEGMYVTAIHSDMLTRSIPPQTPGVMIICSDTLEGLPLYAEVSEVDKNNENGIAVKSSDGSYIFHITENTEIVPLKSRNIATADNLSKGDRLLVYADVLAMSEPAQGTPSKIVIMEDVFETEEASDTLIYSDWANDVILSAFENGYIPEDFGISDFTAYINREKFCDIAYEVLTRCGITATAVYTEETDVNLNILPFTDTDNVKVAVLKEYGIINGKTESEFAPNDSITREEAAAILNRMATFAEIQADEPEYVAYADDSDISDWAKDDVYSVRALGLMEGTGKGFEPAENYTVEEAAATLVRLAEKIDLK